MTSTAKKIVLQIYHSKICITNLSFKNMCSKSIVQKYVLQIYLLKICAANPSFMKYFPVSFNFKMGMAPKTDETMHAAKTRKQRKCIQILVRSCQYAPHLFSKKVRAFTVQVQYLTAITNGRYTQGFLNCFGPHFSLNFETRYMVHETNQTL